MRRISPNVFRPSLRQKLRPSRRSILMTTPLNQAHAVEPCSASKIEIVAPDGTRLGPEDDGEIRVRSSQVCEGYHERAEETARSFQDGWYHSGDIGRMDPDGFLYVVGRLKDMIKTGSINVSPLEVEHVIQSSPRVQDVSVVGVPDSNGVKS